jgi:hypothetical protein
MCLLYSIITYICVLNNMNTKPSNDIGHKRLYDREVLGAKAVAMKNRPTIFLECDVVKSGLPNYMVSYLKRPCSFIPLRISF